MIASLFSEASFAYYFWFSWRFQNTLALLSKNSRHSFSVEKHHAISRIMGHFTFTCLRGRAPNLGRSFGESIGLPEAVLMTLPVPKFERF